MKKTLLLIAGLLSMSMVSPTAQTVNTPEDNVSSVLRQRVEILGILGPYSVDMSSDHACIVLEAPNEPIVGLSPGALSWHVSNGMLYIEGDFEVAGIRAPGDEANLELAVGSISGWQGCYYIHVIGK